MKRLTSIIIVLASMLASMFTFMAPASAGVACYKYGYCGDVYHEINSQRSYLTVTCDWTTKRPNQAVSRGWWATCTDVDGFYVPYGYRAWVSNVGRPITNVGPGWHKVTDIDNPRVALYRR